ncbi:hypothetical protein GCM10010412_026800 [Nonomuraea recticatena]|uniref:Transposase n=2 Tax=Streptosporangiaceae TaxID=2004 RepID=A0ABP6E329_9ACTN
MSESHMLADMTRWLSPDGIEVEHIVRDERPCLRVSHRVNGRRYHVADCWSPEQVALHVDLASLVEVVDLQQIRAKRRPRGDQAVTGASGGRQA